MRFAKPMRVSATAWRLRFGPERRRARGAFADGGAQIARSHISSSVAMDSSAWSRPNMPLWRSLTEKGSDSTQRRSSVSQNAVVCISFSGSSSFPVAHIFVGEEFDFLEADHLRAHQHVAVGARGLASVAAHRSPSSRGFRARAPACSGSRRCSSPRPRASRTPCAPRNPAARRDIAGPGAGKSPWDARW